jgi:hypothetical protein
MKATPNQNLKQTMASAVVTLFLVEGIDYSIPEMAILPFPETRMK